MQSSSIYTSFGDSVSDNGALTFGDKISPFEPKFKVKILEAKKNEDVISFLLLTSKVNDNTEHKVSRDYDDFEWFHHSLFGGVETAGIVIPPLPERPASEADVTSFGSQTKSVIADQCQNDCRAFQRYLRLLVSHEVLGRYQALETFLFNEEAPCKWKVKRSLIGKVTTALDTLRKSNHKDIDEHFQKQKEYAAKYLDELSRFNQCFNKILTSEKKIASGYGHLATTLCMGGSHHFTVLSSVQSNKLLLKFGDIMQGAQHCTAVDVANDENTLSFHLNYALKYAKALKEMLYRRTCLLVAYEDSNRALSKAKPSQEDAAEKSKIAAETALEECTEIARREVTSYHQQRIMSFQEALVQYTEAKIKTARDTYSLLMKSLAQFKHMDVDSV